MKRISNLLELKEAQLDFYQRWRELGRYFCGDCFEQLPLAKKMALKEILLECEISQMADEQNDIEKAQRSATAYRDYLYNEQSIEREDKEKSS